MDTLVDKDNLEDYFKKEIKLKTKKLLLTRGSRVNVINSKKKMKKLIDFTIGLSNYEEKYKYLGKSGVVVDTDLEVDHSKVSFGNNNIWFPITALNLQNEVTIEDVKHLKSKYNTKNAKYQCLKNRLTFYDVVKMYQDKQQNSVSVQRKIIDKLVRKSRMNLKELSLYHKKCDDNYKASQEKFNKNIKRIKRNIILDKLV